MAAANYPAVLDATLKFEGGFVNHPSDPGGATNYGITAKVYAAFLGHAVTPATIRNMTISDARAIYKPQYWAAVRGDDLPLGVDMLVFDFAVNSGPSRAVKSLQKVMGLRQDGHIGAVMVNALSTHADIPNLMSQYCDERMRFVRSLKTFKTFGGGWERRINTVERIALRMAGVSRVGLADIGTMEVAQGKAFDESVSIFRLSLGQGSALAGAGVLGDGLRSAADQFGALGTSSPAIQVVCSALTIAGVALGLYALFQKINSGEAVS